MKVCGKVAPMARASSSSVSYGGDSVSCRPKSPTGWRASVVDLEAWAENVLDAEALEDVFDPNRQLRQHSGNKQLPES